MGVMEWLSILTAVIGAVGTGGVVVGAMRGKLASLEVRLSSIEQRLFEAHRRIDTLRNGHNHS